MFLFIMAVCPQLEFLGPGDWGGDLGVADHQRGTLSATMPVCAVYRKQPRYSPCKYLPFEVGK